MLDAMGVVRRLYGHIAAASFGPLALRAVRDQTIQDGLARTTINSRINRVRRIFRWAASVELVPVAVAQALGTVEGLERGRSKARESKGIKAVPLEHVEAALPHMSPQVAAMVQIQLLTGCRPNEVTAVRGRNLVPGEPCWEYRPDTHKNAWRGQERRIILGPKAVAIVKEFLKPDLDAYLFDPREAHDHRRGWARGKTAEGHRIYRKRPKELRLPKDRYDRRAYYTAVYRACEKARVPRWCPLSLRHTAATSLRARYGLETAANVLGHVKPDTTLIYAERDIERARQVMAQVG
jgi:integrase